MAEPDPDHLADGLLGGDTRALARAVTLLESTRADHRAAARRLLARIAPSAGNAVRIGISGAPGVGKSTFIEALGLHVLDAGHRLAVLAVDPSSPRTGGSLLGDKTRMERLVQGGRAFVRPSPSGGALGGVARRTREAVLACEATGFDVVIIETVGTGQSEGAVAHLSDLFVLLIAPGGGDELQGLKRGIVELADIVVVNKADGELANAARRIRDDYASALGLVRPRSPLWQPPVLLASAFEGIGVNEVWQAIEAFRAAHAGPEGIAARRGAQARAWLWEAVEDGLRDHLHRDARSRRWMAELERQVTAGELEPADGAADILKRILAP
jgi:LAO/AO transport system kinase